MTEPAEGAPFPVEPLDEHNRKLLENVHPPSWQNPRPKERYHLVVVGAGTAGLVSAAGAAGLGAKVALIERHLMGGDCLNVGCVPSKGVLRAARAWQEARDAHARFGGPLVDAAQSFGAAMERMRRLRAQIAPHDSAARFRDLGIDVFLGQGRFVAPDAIEVGGARLRFRRAVIATGARATAPRIPGLAELGYRTNETLFNLTELPPRLAIIGGGPIGCEMAQAFARFGSAVTLLDRGGHVLGREDADAAEIVQQAMARDGVRFVFGARILEARAASAARAADASAAAPGGPSEAAGTPGAGKVLVYEQGGERKEIVADEVLAAAGRTPNTDGLGLEAAGVRYGPNGVEVDDRLRTSNPRIFAAGDICSRFQFTHLADAHARIVIQNALFFGHAKASALIVPWCTYTSPEIAHVGLYEHTAREQGREIETLTLPLSDNDRAILDGEDEGFLRVHLERGKDAILGATLVAAHAGDMLPELCLAITHRVGLGKIASVIHPYPTQSEVIKRAADTWRRGKLTPTVKKIFDWWFRALA